jgi:hypothetical protein
MKKNFLMGTLALAAGMFVSCQPEAVEVGAPGGANKSARIEVGCPCVESYAELTETLQYDQGIKVDVSTDGTNVTYRVYRQDGNHQNGTQIGNLFVDGQSLGGNNVDEYTFQKPLGALATCEVLVTTLVVTGVNGPPVNITLEYVNRPLCSVPPTDCTEETAFGGATSGGGKAWWYYYTAGAGEQPIYAGQNQMAGTVTIDGSGNYTINLAPGWSLQTGEDESVKIQGYSTLPTSRPAAGKFSGPASYKGTSLTGSVAASAYYVVHLDVQYCTTAD